MSLFLHIGYKRFILPKIARKVKRKFAFGLFFYKKHPVAYAQCQKDNRIGFDKMSAERRPARAALKTQEKGHEKEADESPPKKCFQNSAVMLLYRGS